MTEPVSSALYTPVDPHAAEDGAALACGLDHDESAPERASPSPAAPAAPSAGTQALVSAFSSTSVASRTHCGLEAGKAATACVAAVGLATVGVSTGPMELVIIGAAGAQCGLEAIELYECLRR